MSQTISVYDPIFYAQEAIAALTKTLGMASRVFRGYDRDPQEKGSVTSIRVPSSFVAQDAPAASANDLETTEVQVKLDKWKEVKFALTDKDLTLSHQAIITDHIEPAAYAIADAIDQALAGQYINIPWYKAQESSAAVKDITGVRKILFNNKVPMQDGKLNFMVDGNTEDELLQLAAFTQQSGAGDAGVQSQIRGYIGRRYGFDFFANQNVQSHTGGVCADAAGTVGSAAAKGATSVALADLTVGGTAKAGDILKITGHTQQYVITAAVTFTDGTGTALISPGLEAALSGGEVVNLVVGSFTGENLAFHQNAFALAMAPLSRMGDGQGARIETIVDPVSRLTLRARTWYEANNSKFWVGVDALFGVKTLNCNMACRLRDA